MVTYQTQVLAWVAQQGAPTGVALFMLGFAYAFYGLRMLTGLLGLCCAAIGWAAGMLVSEAGGLPGPILAALGTVAFGVLGILRPRLGVVISSTVVGAMIGAYCVNLIGGPPPIFLAFAGAAALAGLLLAILAPRTMPMLLTTTLGTALLLIGFVGAATTFLPEIGRTLRDWSDSYAIVFPLLGGMLFVASYSFQSMQQRGDMITGV